LLDVVQDLLVARFIADQQQPEAVVTHDLERVTADIRLGIARPGHTELAEFTGDRLRTLRIVSEGIVVEEYLLDLRQFLLRPGDFLHDMPDAARAIEMPADGLRPQTKRAARLAAPSGIE